MYELQSINKLLCFIVVRSSRELVWFSAAQSWWTVEAAHHFLQRSKGVQLEPHEVIQVQAP